MGISREQVEKAIEGLEGILPVEDDINKTSTGDLDQPEGGDLGLRENATPKMSDEANKDGGSNKTTQEGTAPKSKKKSPNESTNSVKGEGMENLVFKAKCPKCDDYESDNDGMIDHMKSCSGVKKSLDDWKERTSNDEEISGKMDVSNFLKSVVDQTGGYMDAMKDVIEKSASMYESRTVVIEKQLTDIQENQAKLGIVLKSICEAMRIIEDQPANGPKAETEVKKSDGRHVERNFETGTDKGEEEQTGMFPGLSDNPVIAKSQITFAMVEMVEKGQLKDTDVIAFESGGHIEPDVAMKVQKAIAGNVAA